MNETAQFWKMPPTALELLDAAKQTKIEEINSEYTAAVKPLIKDYPDIEQATWWAQEGEARAYLEWLENQQGDTPATPVLYNILEGRNADDGAETLHELCLAVMDNAAMFTQAQLLTGKRQRLVKKVRKAETQESLDLINWAMGG